MVRKLPLVLAMAAALSPIGVAALGLGEIHPRSALNQGFNADIDLLSVKQGELDDVKVNLASPEAFARAGVERSFLLSKLRFKPKRKADGSAVIEVTSQQSIREPFLNFLVEVNWPKGRLLREYTVLLDPPVTLERGPAPVQAPTQASTSVTGSTAGRSRAGVASAARPVTSSSTTVAEYRTKRRDTLWEIAKKLKSDRASVEQMIMALWQENPHAFYNNNVNNLKVGKILRIPVDEQVRSVGKAQARRDFLVQASAWKAQRRSGVTPAAQPSVAAAKPVLAEPAPVAAVSPATPESELKLASAPAVKEPESPPSEAAGDSELVTDLRNQLLLTQEVGESARQESDDLKSRVDLLESQLQDIQRLLELKNDQLAQLQATVVGRTRAGQALESEGETEAPISDLEQAARDEQFSELEQPTEPVVADAQQQPVSAPGAVDRPSSTDSIFDTLKENATYLGIGGVGLVLLLGLIGLFIKRRREAVAGFQESILVEGETGGVTEELSQASSPKSELTDDISFLSDFTPSDIEAYHEDTGEVDPISEADVYIAYGRYQQAEELLGQAIKQYPERLDLKHKLAEVAYAKKDRETFASVAAELNQAGARRENPEAWQKILVMGSELLPDNELFAGAGSVQINTEDTGVTLDIAADDQTAPGPGTDATGGLDFDLDLGVEHDEAERKEDRFNQDELLGESGAEPSDMEKLGLDLNIDELNELEHALNDDTSSVQDEIEDQFNLEDFTRAEVEGQGMSTLDLDESEQEISIADLDLGDLDLGDKIGDEERLALSDMGLDATPIENEADFLATSESLGAEDQAADEVTTKLDLARAYVDMGDAEGARSILDEVLSEGNANQKKEASVLLENLS